MEGTADVVFSGPDLPRIGASVGRFHRRKALPWRWRGRMAGTESDLQEQRATRVDSPQGDGDLRPQPQLHPTENPAALEEGSSAAPRPEAGVAIRSERARPQSP